MAINFDALPQDKPNSVTEGRLRLTVESVTATLTQDKRESVNVKFKTENGATVFESFVDDSSKPFLMYKLSRFLHAANIKLTGASFKIADLVKLVHKGSTVWADIVKNDRGYPAVSFKGDHKGFYSNAELNEEAASTETPAATNVETSAPSTPALNVTDTDDSY